MPDRLLEVMSHKTDDFLSAGNLELADETVTEVFGTMLGFAIEVVPNPAALSNSGEQNDKTAVIGFSGSMRGSCAVRLSSMAAGSIASAMLGGVSEEGDDSIDDAVGEICNMIAGGWKNRISALSSNCSLSPPTVISGRGYKVYMVKPSVKALRTYKFDAFTFQLTLEYEQRTTAIA